MLEVLTQIKRNMGKKFTSEREEAVWWMQNAEQVAARPEVKESGHSAQAVREAAVSMSMFLHELADDQKDILRHQLGVWMRGDEESLLSLACTMASLVTNDMLYGPSFVKKIMLQATAVERVRSMYTGEDLVNLNSVLKRYKMDEKLNGVFTAMLAKIIKDRS